MFWRVMDLETVPEFCPAPWPKMGDQGLARVGRKIVHNNMNLGGCRIGSTYVTHYVRKLRALPVLSNFDHMSPTIWLDHTKGIHSTFALVLIVFATGLPTSGYPARRVDILQQLNRFFVEADHWFSKRERPLISFQHIFHLADVLTV